MRQLLDIIETLRSIIKGNTLYDGQIFHYLPDNEYRAEVFNSWSEEKKDEYKKFREEDAPKLLEKLRQKLKEYEVNTND